MVVGLGNPGKIYTHSRHNVGFMTVERFASIHGLSFSKKRFRASLALGEVASSPLLLVKPLTFMNRSGLAVASLMAYYQIPLEEMVVICDDADLPLGKLRIRKKGSSGGHKGLTSIIEQAGGQEFPRLRIGIGRESPERDLSQYVLEHFTKEERPMVETSIERACEALLLLLQGEVERAMNLYN